MVPPTSRRPVRAGRSGGQGTRAAGAEYSVPIEEHHLANGLRVVMSPDPQSAVIAVGVYYKVGFRLEPEGRTGFAHLFEHLMFQGSRRLPKMAHFQVVHDAGGVLNGFTRHDYTAYFEVLPATALEAACYLEADRMAGLDLTEANLRNQVDVVEEEVRLNVLNQPYGGFSWLVLPQHAFTRFANAHNSYGEFRDLESATVADAEAFFTTHYAPGNATLVLVGGFDPAGALAAVDRHFGVIPKRRTPRAPDTTEQLPTRRLMVPHQDPMAPVPRLGVGYRMAPFGDPAHLPLTLAADILTDGRGSRLDERLVRGAGVLLDVAAGPNFPIGDAFDSGDPTLWVLEATRRPEVPTSRVLELLDAEVDRLGREGPSPDELLRAQRRWLAEHWAHMDSPRGRMDRLGTLTTVHGDPNLLNAIPGGIAAVTPEAVARAVRTWLRRDRSTVLDWIPGGPAA
ncbi:MAG TPA: pitrilysin family protein [Candidatus Micrarchaeia archaeon]|nr:pitrilysin family protein [Candidatus Micrarchaeia archaeon]